MKTKARRLTEALLETADGMHRIGIMDDATHHQVTVRQLGREPLPTAALISSAKIRT